MKEEKQKILIVDDEPNIVMSLDFLLRKAGYELFIARNGQEAMDLVLTKKPQLILLDIMMPGMDGYEVCHEVKNKKGYERTKVIFLSAKSKPNDIEEGMKAGADEYITKPFSNKQLLQKIKEIVNS